jgi:hypothetical protein
MAEEHNQLKYGSPLSKAASVLSGGGYGDVGVSRLSETLYPCIDLWSRPEFARLREERIWIINPSTGAVAAELAAVGVFNPTDSNLIVVVKGFLVDPSAATTAVQVRVAANSTVTFDATSTVNARDTRIPVQTGCRTGSFAHNSAAVIGALMGQYRYLANSAVDEIELDIVLSPGFFLAVQHTAVNVALNATLRGYERVAFPGELRG